MTEADLPAADELRRLAGWNQTPDDWRRLLALGPGGCFVATLGDVVVGTVTTTAYGRELAWIGMMLVHPEHRRLGIGTKLMRRALDHLHNRGVTCVKLDATPAGRPLYEQLGFVFASGLTRWKREATVPPPACPHDVPLTRPLTEMDWPAVEKIDAAAFGAPRFRLLRSFSEATRQSLVWPAAGPISGWGLLRAGACSDYLGPAACSGPEALTALVPTLICSAGTRAVTWDIPDDNDKARAMARQLNFAPARPLTRMRLGAEVVAASPQSLLAIADPAVG